MYDVEGRIAIVTGGSKGIGRAIVQRLCQEGVLCVIANRNKSEGEQYAHDLLREGHQAVAISTDVS
ncbi:MAG: SDR family NAD(P)-dependent oxidoreductase, partial [Candidatus Caldatribacteriaceae bacterium]